MKDSAVVVIRDYVGLFLAGIGIAFPMHQFFGGLFLAIAGASFARAFSPEQDEREFWVVILGAALVAVNACTNTDVALLYNEGAGAASDVTTHATATGRWF